MGGEDLVLRFVGLDLLSNVAAAIGSRIDGLMKSIGSSGTELGKSFASVGKVAVGMGAGLLAVSAALTAVVVATGVAAATFEQKMTLLHTQAGATTAEVRHMTQAVLDIAPAVGYGPDKLADAMYHVESLGFRGAKALNLLEVAAKGAQIGNADLESTVNALGGVLVAEVGGVHSAAEAMAVLDATVGVGNMRMQDLVNAMSTGVVPAGKNFGLTLQEINGALATLTDNAVPADEAATRLRMTFALIGAPTRQATKELASIGISQLQLAHDMRGPNGLVVALTDLHNHLVRSGKSAEEQSYIITRAFGGGRSSAGIMTLLNSLDRLNQRTQQITAMTGTFGERFAERAQNANFALAQLHATFERLVILVGTAVLPVFAAVVRFITPIITVIGTWVEHHQRLTAMILIGGIVLTALAGIFLVVFGTIAIVLGGVLALVAALPLMAVAVTPVLVALGVTLVAMVALAGAIMGVIWAIQHWSEIRRVAQDVWGFVSPYVMAALNAISGAVQSFVSATTAWWQDHGEQVRQIWDGIVQVVRFAWDAIVRFTTLAVAILLPFIRSAFGNIGNVVTTTWDLIVNVLRTAWDVILTLFSVELDLLTGNWGRAWDDIRSGVGRVFGDIVRTGEQFGADLVHAIVSGVTNLGSDIGSAVERVMPGPLKKFLGVGDDVGKQIATGIAQGIESRTELIDRAAERATSIAPAVAPSGRALDVPATRAAPLPQLAPEPSGLQRAWNRAKEIIASGVRDIGGVLNGLGQRAHSIWQAFANDPLYYVGLAVGTVVFGAENMYRGVTQWLQQLYINAILWINRTVLGIEAWWNQLPGRITIGLRAAGTAVEQWGRSVYLAGLNAATQFVATVGRFFSQLPGTIGNWLNQTIAAAGRWIAQMHSAADRGARDFITTLGQILSRLPGQMFSVGQSIVQGIVRGILSLKDWAGQQIGNFIHGLVDAATRAGRGGSPFMLFADTVGVPIGQGIALGLYESTSEVQAAIAGILQYDPSYTVQKIRDLVGGMTLGAAIPMVSASRHLPDDLAAYEVEQAYGLRDAALWAMPDHGDTFQLPGYQPTHTKAPAASAQAEVNLLQVIADRLTDIFTLIDKASGASSTDANSGGIADSQLQTQLAQFGWWLVQIAESQRMKGIRPVGVGVGQGGEMLG